MEACSSNVLTYGQDKNCDLYIKHFDIYTNRSEIDIIYNKKEYHITSPLLGDFNVYNLCGALLTCLSLGFKMEDMIPRIEKLERSIK